MMLLLAPMMSSVGPKLRYLFPNPTWKVMVKLATYIAAPIAASCQELLKCGCRISCSGNCKCFRPGLPCTALCSCNCSEFRSFASYLVFSSFFCNISISFEIINQKGVQHTIKVSFHIYVHCTCAKIQAVLVL
jgi:hypothetical protein